MWGIAQITIMVSFYLRYLDQSAAPPHSKAFHWSRGLEIQEEDSPSCVVTLPLL